MARRVAWERLSWALAFGAATTIALACLIARWYEYIPVAIFVLKHGPYGWTNVCPSHFGAATWRWRPLRGLETVNVTLWRVEQVARWQFRPSFNYRITDRTDPPHWSTPIDDAVRVARKAFPNSDLALSLHEYNEVAAGWPFLAMRATDLVPEASRSVLDSWRAGITLGSKRSGPRVIPLYPIWTGFLADTLVFAVPWYGAMLTLRHLRRRLNARYNRCPHCKYSLVGLTASICPECGTPR